MIKATKHLVAILGAGVVFAAAAAAALPAMATAAHRSQSAKRAFARQSPCPSTGLPKPHCPGFVIDHVIPLCAGGADSPLNMQWQGLAASKKKDRLEDAQCRQLRKKAAR